MSEPVWRQFDNSSRLHIARRWRYFNAWYFVAACSTPSGIHCAESYLFDRPDLPKCKRCLALLEDEE
jgi:hypothetical protein